MLRHGSVGSELGNLDAYIYGVVLDNNEIRNFKEDALSMGVHVELTTVQVVIRMK